MAIGAHEEGGEPERRRRPSSLRPLRAALELIAQLPPQAAGRVQLPAGAAAALEGMPARSGAEKRRLAELVAEVCRCAEARGEERVESARRCLLLLRLARRAAVASRYGRGSREPVADRLQRLASPLRYAYGVGPRRAEILAGFGLETVEDLLYHLPFRYERRQVRPIAELAAGETATVVGELVALHQRRVGRRGRVLLEGILRDASGLLRLVWYRGGAYVPRRYPPGRRYRVHGRVEVAPDGARRMAHPQMDPAAGSVGDRVVPVYRKPGELSGRVMRAIASRAVRDFARCVPGVLPRPVAERAGALDPARALRFLHAPPAGADVAALNEFRSRAHRALALEELFLFQVGLLLTRRGGDGACGLAMPSTGQLTERLRRHLPFRLTGAQERAIAEVLADMAAPRPMSRLLLGDVGAGKTVVALFAAAAAIENGRKVLVLAPTRILAEQHADLLRRYLDPLGVRVALVTGAPSGSGSEAGVEEAGVVVGTHGVLERAEAASGIGLVVVDEQQRFGVRHRARLVLGRAQRPDMLLISATPIPRTLALTLYGDLDLTVIDEVPAGRRRVETHVLEAKERRRAYEMVRRRLETGRPAYIVFPRIGAEVDGEEEIRSLAAAARELQETLFPEFGVGVVHGRMSAAEIEEVVANFRRGDIRVLAGTTVLEVGVDVPEAGSILVEDADRFGLAQLHQLRGRVGRDGREADCILLQSAEPTAQARERLAALAGCEDGFRVAELDLAQRGPGDLLGTRQAGLPGLRAIGLLREARVAQEARDLARWWLEKDPGLSSPQSAVLREVLRRRWEGLIDLGSVG